LSSDMRFSLGVLQGFWSDARAGTAGEGAGTALAGVLEAACLRVLDRLYPRS